MPRALFRCDASPEIGAGHVTRCLGLAEALAETGWRVAFAARRGTAAMMRATATGDFAVRELADAAQDEPTALRGYCPDGVDLLVVDHYQRNIRFEEACRGWARQILVMDDATGRQHDCDFLVDAAVNDRSIYAGGVPAQARLLLGPAYALVRRSFVAQRAAALQRRDGRPVENILVSFGATDPWNATSVALDALESFAEDYAITVALSSQAPHLDKVRHRLNGRAEAKLDADMAALMTEADLAIGAAGASAYERAVLGLPSIVVTVADNQHGIAKLFAAAGAAVDAGPFDATLVSRLGPMAQTLVDDSAARMRMTKAAAALSDGRGWQRLLAELAGETRAGDGSRVRFRLAEECDGDWLLQLQQAPPTRRHSRNPSVPSAEEHACWMTRVLANPDVFFLLIEVDGERAGYVRLDRLKSENAAFEISVAVCPRLYGRGIGSAALSLARRLQPSAPFDAEILPENTASRLLFGKAGYQQVSETQFRQEPSHIAAGMPKI